MMFTPGNSANMVKAATLTSITSRSSLLSTSLRFVLVQGRMPTMTCGWAALMKLAVERGVFFEEKRGFWKSVFEKWFLKSGF